MPSCRRLIRMCFWGRRVLIVYPATKARTDSKPYNTSKVKTVESTYLAATPRSKKQTTATVLPESSLTSPTQLTNSLLPTSTLDQVKSSTASQLAWRLKSPSSSRVIIRRRGALPTKLLVLEVGLKTKEKRECILEISPWIWISKALLNKSCTLAWKKAYLWAFKCSKRKRLNSWIWINLRVFLLERWLFRLWIMTRSLVMHPIE